MRILYIHQYFVPPDGPGVTRSYELARRLIAKGHRVCMITSSADLPDHYRNLKSRVVRMEIAGIPLVIIDMPYRNEMTFGERMRVFLLFAVLASIQALRQPADVVFASSTPLTIAIPGMVAKLWHRIPMVFEVRDLWPELPIAVGALRNPLARGMARALEWLAYHASAQIVALSPGMAEGVQKRGIAPEKITVIPNSCDVELFDVPAPRGQRIRDCLPSLAEGQPLILYAGTFNFVNGLGYLVDIAAAMRDIAPEARFLLVGTGAKRGEIIDKAQSLGVLDNTMWVWDPLPKLEMPDVLAAATVATSLFIPLQPIWNNSANKFFDALAAGKPIAINYGGWQAALLKESGAGIVLPADDPMRAAQLLASFVRDPHRLSRASAAARELARTHFHRDMMACKLETTLRQAVNGR
jgi:glycosyltransferase involved in cell wall biosynthesis